MLRPLNMAVFVAFLRPEWLVFRILLRQNFCAATVPKSLQVKES